MVAMEDHLVVGGGTPYWTLKAESRCPNCRAVAVKEHYVHIGATLESRGNIYQLGDRVPELNGVKDMTVLDGDVMIGSPVDCCDAMHIYYGFTVVDEAVVSVSPLSFTKDPYEDPIFGTYIEVEWADDDAS